jgi:polar amino acid transport system permease protein
MTAGEYAARGLIVPLFSSGVFFLAFIGALTLLFGWFERKLDYFRV